MQLLSRAGGGIWPDETQQPTVIPLRDGALMRQKGTVLIPAERIAF